MSDTSRVAVKHLLCAPLTVPRNTDVIALVRLAIDEERERCARIVDNFLMIKTSVDVGIVVDLTTAIRNGVGE